MNEVFPLRDTRSDRAIDPSVSNGEGAESWNPESDRRINERATQRGRVSIGLILL